MHNLTHTIMKQDPKNASHYKADEGYVFIRIVDGFVMGKDLYLGLFIDDSEDTIDNYEEVEIVDGPEAVDAEL